MAKIIIAGDAVVLTSSLKLEDIKTVEKYRPNALVLKGGEDGKEPIFKIETAAGKGKLDKYGAIFGSETRDAEKLAILTMVLPEIPADTDVEDYVADKIGGALINLNKLETALPEVIAEINAEKAEVKSNITIAQ